MFLRLKITNFAGAAANQTAAVQTALVAAVGTPQVGIDVQITLATIFPAGVPQSVVPSVGSIAGGVWTLPITSFVGSATLTASSAGSTKTWLVEWTAASVLSLSSTNLPAVGTVIPALGVVNFTSGGAPVPYTVQEGCSVTIIGGSGDEKLPLVTGSAGEIINCALQGGGSVRVDEMSRTQIRGRLIGTGVNIELIATAPDHPSVCVLMALDTVSDTAFIETYTVAAGVATLYNSASASIAAWTPQSVTALTWCGGLERNPLDTALPPPFVVAMTYERTSDGRFAPVVSPTHLIVVASRTDIGSASIRAAIAGTCAPTSTTPRALILQRDPPNDVATALAPTLLVGAAMGAVNLKNCFTGGYGPLSISVAGLPLGLTLSDGIVSGTPIAGAGGVYQVEVTASDSAQSLKVPAQITVNEERSIQSVSIRNAADHTTTIKVGDTAEMVIQMRGYPPAAGGSGGSLQRGWGPDGVTWPASGGTWEIPAGTININARARVQLLDGTTWSDYVLATPLAVASGQTEVPPQVPTVLDAAYATRSGRVVTIYAGSAQGNPTPTAALHALTEDGIDVLASATGTGPWTYTAGGTDEDLVAFTVRWSNTAGTADSSASIVVPADSSTTPAAPASTDWRVVPTMTDAASVYIAVDKIPADATAIQYQIDGGAWVSTDYVTPGVFTVAGLSAGSHDFALRFANASGAGSASAAKSATPAAASNTLMPCWADGEAAQTCTTLPVSTVNQPTAVTGGGEAEAVDWATSLFKTKNTSAPASYWTGVIYDPMGTGAALRPCERSDRTFGSMTIAVLGAAGMYTQPAMSAVGWDADGDPVVFLFDKRYEVGRFPDGRPFVVGPVRLAHNGGDPITVTPNATTGYTVATYAGAKLCVVARRGIIPPVDAATTAVALLPAYVRRASAVSDADWATATWGSWNNTTAANATGLNARANLENIGIYYNKSTSGAVLVRFKKVGDANYYPALDLYHDSRDRSGAGTPFSYKHRGLIRYLEPGAEYRVELKDGSTYVGGTITTRPRKPAKATAALGTVNGNVTISRSGDTVTVTRAGLSTLTINCPSGGYAEIRDGIVRGTIIVEDDCQRVILRNVSVFGGAPNLIELGANVFDFRVLGGRFAAWGKRNAANEWCEHQCCVIRHPASSTVYGTVLMGAQIGSPRFGANAWEENTTETYQKPYGPNVLAGNSGSANGLIHVSDCSISPHFLRALSDGLGSMSGNKETTSAGGYGPDSAILRNYVTGPADDGIELEGRCPNGWIAHNWIELRLNRPNTSVRASLALDAVGISPVRVEHNVHEFDARGVTNAEAGSFPVGYKLGKAKDGTMGYARFDHETIISFTTASTNNQFRKLNSADGKSIPGDVTNLFCSISATSNQAPYMDTSKFVDVVIDAGAIESANAFSTAAVPTGSAVVDDGTIIAGVNDGGPFYAATPPIGALRP